MATEGNNRSNRVNFNGGNGKESFEEHNESMREFHKNHAPELLVEVSRRDLINTMWPLLISGAVRDTGGKTGLTSTADWSALFPVGKVKTYRLSSN